jgi:exosortase
MKSTVANAASSAPAIPARTIRSIALPAVLLALIWAEVINQLRPEWWLNPQYNYGLLVPALMLYLLWRRWPERPLPIPLASNVVPVALMICSALMFFPIRFVAAANPDWRLLDWALALLAVTVSLLIVLIAGGWPWLRYFSFPFLFFLVAVPWPVRFEQMVVQNLMRDVSAINVALLNLADIPALQHGNVIEVGSGLIGVEEACSGVRSLQATLMISLFLGELYFFKNWPRVFLVLSGAVLAFVCNVIRTAFLVWIGAHRGANALEAWHDPAGLTILIVCLFGLWVVSLIMRRHSSSSSETPINIDNRSAPISLSPGLIGSLLVWFVVAEATVQIWYASHQSLSANSRWRVQWPTSENSYQSLNIPPEVAGLLHYNEGGGATWQSADGRYWTMYFFSWLPGGTAARFVKVHRPDICLPASGMTMQRDNGLRLLTVNGVTMPIRSYRFDNHGTPLHVFYCYWDARSSYENAAAAQEEDWSARGRVRTALEGRREIGAQMLEIVVDGYSDDGDATAALERKLTELIRAS